MSEALSWRASSPKRLEAKLIAMAGYPAIAALGATLRWRTEGLEHLDTPLVLWAWAPGDGRTTPPMSHAEFKQKMREWIDKGAVVPE